jgi:alpha-ketoglutarate-dependent 2,4-dichlorophenoxyacetate dioxygenase
MKATHEAADARRGGIMEFTLNQLHPHFFAEVIGLDLSRPLDEAQLNAVTAASDLYGVLVFRDQKIEDEDQLRFTHYFGEPQKSITLDRQDYVRRFRREELSDISNLDEHGLRLDPADTKRKLALSTRLWHADSSFRIPSGKFTFLAAKRLPPSGGNTEFADMRAAWDALPEERRPGLLSLEVRHSLAYSRRISNSPELDAKEVTAFPPAVQPLVRVHPGSGRRSLYLGMHAESIVGWDRAQGRALLDELTAHATAPRFVHAHVWRDGDVVMWDNRCCMHRAMPFDEERYVREMRRTTVAEEKSPALLA